MMINREYVRTWKEQLKIPTVLPWHKPAGMKEIHRKL
jgi:hypothetical protein